MDEPDGTAFAVAEATLTLGCVGKPVKSRVASKALVESDGRQQTRAESWELTFCEA